jgi:hypothetical protein
VTTTPVFERLNPAQRAAARFGERDESGAYRAGPLLIIAGAGTARPIRWRIGLRIWCWRV